MSTFYMSSAARKIATIEIVLRTPPLMLETPNEESESDEVEVLLTFSLLLLLHSAGSGLSIVPCLVHVLGCDTFEIDFGNLGLVTVGPLFCVLASSAGCGGSGQLLRC